VYKHILIPTDGSQLSDEAIRHGIEFAKETGAKVSFLTVTEPFHTISVRLAQVEDTPGEYQRHVAERAARRLAAGAVIAREAGVSYDEISVEDHHPYRAIIQTAEANGCDLIVMASHGRRGISAMVLGSQTVSVLTHSSIPVLVYRLPRSPAQSVQAVSETDALIETAGLP
jgi:nucleotide-binding universal stress UspA family protein